MKKNKILIISYYWPPSGGSGVHRWLNFSNALIKRGWDVTVFTAKNPNYLIIDNKLCNQVDKSIKVLKIPILEPNNFLNIKKANNTKPLGIGNRLMIWVRANIFFPDSRMFWIKKVANKATNYINKNNIDCLITTAPPFSTHLIGLKVKKNTGIKWIADFRDPWSEFFQFKLLPLLSFQKKKHNIYENKCLKSADTIITTSPSLTKKYSLINSNSKTIYNGFNSFIKGRKSKKFLIMYTGLMKSVQNPQNLWEVLREICLENESFFKDLSVRLIGDFDEDIMEDINIKLMKSNVKFEKYLEKEHLDKEVCKASVLLLSSVNIDSVNNIIPGKLYYYFSVKRPILAFSNLNSDVHNIINQTKTGRVFTYLNKLDLKNHILELYSNYKTGNDNFSTLGLSNYTYNKLSLSLDDILKKTID